MVSFHAMLDGSRCDLDAGKEGYVDQQTPDSA
jgi:hypothetical protein